MEIADLAIFASIFKTPNSSSWQHLHQFLFKIFFRLMGFIAMLFLCTLAACATLGNYEERVRVTITDMMPLESTLMEQRYLIKLRIQNRSNQPLVINGVSFEMSLNGKAFASGVGNQNVTAPAYGEAMIEVKASSTIFGLIRQIRSIPELETKPFQYEISGNLSTTDDFFRIPYNESGEIDLRPPSEAINLK